MKKILVFSDSHGNIENMIEVVQNNRPDMIIHLGDCWRDAQNLQDEFPDIPLEQVPGNCDFSREIAERVLLIEGKRVLICHGHTYHVKAGYLNIEYGAKEKNADVVLFGHTHRVYYDYHNGLVMLNPGSIGYSTLSPASYGWLMIDGKNNKISVDVGYLE
ncbi:MAG: metallophosphoesterase [Lachnospiraceae bacterium]|nr:metallophosphoesterase [Lachnospiraceae bacterium]